MNLQGAAPDVAPLAGTARRLYLKYGNVTRGGFRGCALLVKLEKVSVLLALMPSQILDVFEALVAEEALWTVFVYQRENHGPCCGMA